MWRKSSHSNPNGECVEMNWVKSSHSNPSGCCVEWRKSTRSHANGNCVETGGAVLVRDSKLGDGSPVLTFTPDAWAEFVFAVKDL